LNVDSLMETNNSLGCDLINANVSELNIQIISRQETFVIFFFNACFDRGTQYLLTVDFGRFLPDTAVLEVDSVSMIISFNQTLLHVFYIDCINTTFPRD